MMPNTAFGLLITFASLLAVFMPSSIARLLVAGGWNGTPGNTEADLRCMLVPTQSDLTVHLLSYGLLFAVLAGGVAGGTTFFSQWRRTERFVRRLLVQRAVERATLERLAGRIGLAGRVDLVQSDEPRCFCYGLVRPRVCITTRLVQMLDRSELEAVLRHEAYHLRNYDPLRILLGRALVSAFFFVPALRDLFAHYELHVELIADRQAVRQMRGPGSLAAALDKLLDARTAGPASLPAIAHGGSLELRIDSLLGDSVAPPTLKGWRRGIVSVLLMLLITAPALAPLVGAEPKIFSALAATPHAAC